MTVTARRLAELAELDATIAKTADNAALALMQHRANAVDEVGSAAAYAKAIGRDRTTVGRYVAAWALWTDVARDQRRTPSDCLHLAGMTEDRATAAEAVADAKGIGVTRVAQSAKHRADVNRVRDAIRDTPAEDKPVRARKLAKQIERTRTNQRQRAAEKRANRTRVYIALDGKLAKALAALRDAVDLAHGANLPPESEEAELIRDAIAGVTAALNLLKLTITGATDVDWDAELERITPK